MVLVPMTIWETEGASEMGVPETVMAPPGVRVWEPTRYWDCVLAVMVWPAIVRGGGVVVELEVRGMVLVPMMT